MNLTKLFRTFRKNTFNRLLPSSQSSMAITWSLRLTLSWGRLILCRANQWTGFFMITASLMKELIQKSNLNFDFSFSIHWNNTVKNVFIRLSSYFAFNPLSTNLTKWSNILKKFVGNSLRLVWVCLTILWGWPLKGYKEGILGVSHFQKQQLRIEFEPYF